MLLASLPMYDWPELHDANNEIWTFLHQEFKSRGLSTSPALHRQDDDYSQLWTSPKMLMSQTCGLPLVTSLHEKALAFAAPHFDCPGAGPGTYSSAIIVRKNDTAENLSQTQGYKLGYNDPDSQSGFGTLRHFAMSQSLAPQHFSSGTATGGHRNSLAMVAKGEIDIAAIDCLCWDLAQEFDPEITDKLKAIAWTERTPAMPFIINQHCPLDRDLMFGILNEVMTEMASFETLAALRYKAIVPCTNAFYQYVLQQAEESKDFKLF